MTPIRIALALALLVALALPATAGAAVPLKEITSGGPLTRVIVGNELSCQIAHASDTALELYPSGTTPGDCGTFVTAGGTLFSPDFGNHGGTATTGKFTSTAFTPVSQSDVSGSGSSGSPFRVTTVADAAAAGLRITQVDTYVVGEEAYRTDITIANTGGGAQTGVIYRAGDCYLQGSDQGFGFVDQAAAGPGCSQNANNSPAGRIEQWYPRTPGAQYMEAHYSEVWAHIGTMAPFPNTTEADQTQDNGAGISWNYSVAPGASQTFSHFTVFSPTGVSGPPPSSGTTPATTPPAFGPGGVVVAPSNRTCRSRRNFRIRLRHRPGTRILSAVVRVNGRTVATRRGRRVTAPVDLRGLPRGRYTVKITILTTDGRTISGTRRYRTCTPRRRAPRV